MNKQIRSSLSFVLLFSFAASVFQPQVFALPSPQEIIEIAKRETSKTSDNTMTYFEVNGYNHEKSEVCGNGYEIYRDVGLNIGAEEIETGIFGEEKFTIPIRNLSDSVSLYMLDSLKFEIANTRAPQSHAESIKDNITKAGGKVFYISWRTASFRNRFVVGYYGVKINKLYHKKNKNHLTHKKWDAWTRKNMNFYRIYDEELVDEKELELYYVSPVKLKIHKSKKFDSQVNALVAMENFITENCGNDNKRVIYSSLSKPSSDKFTYEIIYLPFADNKTEENK